MYLLLHVMLLFKYFEKFNRDGLIGKIIHFLRQETYHTILDKPFLFIPITGAFIGSPFK